MAFRPIGWGIPLSGRRLRHEGQCQVPEVLLASGRRPCADLAGHLLDESALWPGDCRLDGEGAAVGGLGGDGGMPRTGGLRNGVVSAGGGGGGGAAYQ